MSSRMATDVRCGSKCPALHPAKIPPIPETHDESGGLGLHLDPCSGRTQLGAPITSMHLRYLPTCLLLSEFSQCPPTPRQPSCEQQFMHNQAR